MTDLEALAAGLREATGEDVEIVGDSIYVNFAHRVAVVVGYGEGFWCGVVTEWDASGGVHAEREIVTHPMPHVIMGHIVRFLKEERKHEAELEAKWGEGE